MSETSRAELTQLLLERSTYKALAIRATETLWNMLKEVEAGDVSAETRTAAVDIYYDLKEATGR